MSIDFNELTKENLKRFRKEKNLSQTELAEKMGINHSHYNRIEKGNVTPTIDSLAKASIALEVDLYQFFLHPQVHKLPNFERWKLFEELPLEEKNAINRIINITLESHKRQ